AAEDCHRRRSAGRHPRGSGRYTRRPRFVLGDAHPRPSQYIHSLFAVVFFRPDVRTHVSRRPPARGVAVSRGACMGWLFYAAVSAIAAAATAILAKIGVEGVPSTLATAFRTTVVLVLSWAFVVAVGEQKSLHAISRRSVLFL